jgi:hypothetical protein
MFFFFFLALFLFSHPTVIPQATNFIKRTPTAFDVGGNGTVRKTFIYIVGFGSISLRLAFNVFIASLKRLQVFYLQHY